MRAFRWLWNFRSRYFTINGVPLVDCTLGELWGEYVSGIALDQRGGLTRAERKRLMAVRRELQSRDAPLP